jgi:hypothetical protein
MGQDAAAFSRSGHGRQSKCKKCLIVSVYTFASFKIILLKNYAPQHLILMPAFRSPDTTRVCLFNNTYMSRNPDQVPDIK